jgi:hypothetical protein
MSPKKLNATIRCGTATIQKQLAQRMVGASGLLAKAFQAMARWDTDSIKLITVKSDSHLSDFCDIALSGNNMWLYWKSDTKYVLDLLNTAFICVYIVQQDDVVVETHVHCSEYYTPIMLFELTINQSVCQRPVCFATPMGTNNTTYIMTNMYVVRFIHVASKKPAIANTVSVIELGSVFSSLPASGRPRNHRPGLNITVYVKRKSLVSYNACNKLPIKNAVWNDMPGNSPLQITCHRAPVIK